jgi:hypothetical protein
MAWAGSLRRMMTVLTRMLQLMIDRRIGSIPVLGSDRLLGLFRALLFGLRRTAAELA